jgi:hypothetical protein
LTAQRHNSRKAGSNLWFFILKSRFVENKILGEQPHGVTYAQQEVVSGQCEAYGIMVKTLNIHTLVIKRVVRDSNKPVSTLVIQTSNSTNESMTKLNTKYSPRLKVDYLITTPALPVFPSSNIINYFCEHHIITLMIPQH